MATKKIHDISICIMLGYGKRQKKGKKRKFRRRKEN